MILYSLVDRYQCLKGTCCIHLKGRRDSSTQKMVTEYSFKHRDLSTRLYITTWKTVISKEQQTTLH